MSSEGLKESVSKYVDAPDEKSFGVIRAGYALESTCGDIKRSL